MVTHLVIIILVILVALLIVSQQYDISGGATLKSSDRVKDLKKFPASRFETYVRSKIEMLTGRHFPCVYPKWLKHKGKSLELDGYNAELKLAFETQGPQHTAFRKATDTIKRTFKNRVENDKAKIEICDRLNVGLIIVDYKVPKHIIGSYVRSRIFDIAEVWRSRGLHGQVNALGILADRAGDYVGVITNIAET